MHITITIPERLIKKAEELGIDIEDFTIESLIEKLGLNPEESIEIRIELAEKYLKEGVSLAEKDPVEASEKIYKSAEKCVKASAVYLNLEEILRRVRERGRWTVTELERAVREASKRMGEDIHIGWDVANYLHVWGFHEAKLDGDAVSRRIPYVEKMLGAVRKAVGKSER